MHVYTNDLIHEGSPYLQQHAHNPVNWVAWSPEVFERAQRENKLVLISVGYSACHWCHVMEHECFEDEEVAQLMNEHFINVKVDREERPDVDQLYMTAVQLMTQQGGWPLNCFTLPDGRPVYGGTYFPKNQWMHILRSLQHTFEHDLEKVLEYAQQLHEGVLRSELIEVPVEPTPFEEEKLHELVTRWMRSVDHVEGGPSRAPKFPLPSNYRFLLHYGSRFQHERVLKHVELTLNKMTMGGIYDQVGGGFTRYSVDVLWKVPHFEKMLYDNGQLLSLYSEAYKWFKKPLYKRTVYGIFQWLEREMKHSEGCYYAALDADSEGEEGKFYCWTKTDFEHTLEKDAALASEIYSINARGHWEDGKYIPLRTMSDGELMRKYGWDEVELEENIARINQKLLDERRHRVRPGLDSKCLTSWNALVLKGLCDAFQAFGDLEFKQAALKIARWIEKYQLTEDNRLWRNRMNGKSSINGFLEDYATTIEGFIALYEITFDTHWMTRAKELAESTLKHFQHSESRMFYFTPESTELIARKMELNDNVIPSGNSMMGINLFKLAGYFHTEKWRKDAEQLLANVYDGMEMYGSGYSNWAILLLHTTGKFHELTFAGEQVQDWKSMMQRYYLPDALYADAASGLPVSEGKSIESDAIYVCYEGTCLLPATSPEEALRLVLK